MYKPEDMVVPAAYEIDDWDPPEYVKSAERARAADPSLGQMAGLFAGRFETRGAWKRARSPAG